MNVRTLRLIKEARPLFWPWLVVAALGVTPLLIGEWWIGTLTALGALLGIPLLATLPFSSEFQHHTLPGLLSQPVERTEIWAEKTAVALVAVVSAAAVYYLNWQLGPAWHLLVLLTLCSATYWTLIGKSTISGLMLNLVAGGLLIGIILYIASVVVFIGVLSLALLMFWLGRRKFVRFESTGTLDGTDLMAGALGGAFRADSVSALRNLVRKELRLLFPVWLFSLIAIVFLIGLTPFQLKFASWAGAAIAGVALAIAPLLAGTLSVGEERTSGTQTWNLVLPMSIRRQWMMKFLTGLLTCLASQAMVLLVVAVIGEKVFDPEVMLLLNSLSSRLGLVGLSIAIFIAAFWCACVVSGTVRASLLTFPVVALTAATILLGFRLGANKAIVDFYGLLLATFHPYPYSFSQRTFEWIGVGLPFVLIAPVFVVAVVQSYRLFRRDVTSQDWRFIALRLFPLLIVALLSGMAMLAGRVFLFAPYAQERQVMTEVHGAVVQFYLDAGTLDATHPARVTPDELARLPGLSRVARAWVKDAAIVIFPNDRLGSAQRTFQGPRVSPYYISMTYPNGRECRTAGIHGWCKEPEGIRATLGSGPYVPTTFVSADVVEPMLLSSVQPVLPRDTDRKKPVTVILKISIGPDGSVTWVQPLRGEDPFTSAAVKAVQQWRYQPMHMLGWPTNVVTTVTFNVFS